MSEGVKNWKFKKKRRVSLSLDLSVRKYAINEGAKASNKSSRAETLPNFTEKLSFLTCRKARNNENKNAYVGYSSQICNSAYTGSLSFFISQELFTF